MKIVGIDNVKDKCEAVSFTVIYRGLLGMARADVAICLRSTTPEYSVRLGTDDLFYHDAEIKQYAILNDINEITSKDWYMKR